MTWEQDPWTVPGGVRAPRRDRASGIPGGGSRRRGERGGSGWLWLIALGAFSFAAWTLVFGEQGVIHQREVDKRLTHLRSELADARGDVRKLEAEAADPKKTIRERMITVFGRVPDNVIIYRTGPPDSAAGAVSSAIVPPTVEPSLGIPSTRPHTQEAKQPVVQKRSSGHKAPSPKRRSSSHHP